MPQVITTSHAPAAIGTYSQAIRVGKTVYISGQIPLDPKTMQLASHDFKIQVATIINNIQAIAQAAGANLSAIVKLTVYLTDLDNFNSVNEVMTELWPTPYPARAAVEVSRLPRDVACEMDAIMVLESDA